MSTSWRWFAILAFAGGSVFACTTDLSAPADNFGSASPTGSVRVRSDLATLDFGGGLTLPIYAEFDSTKDGLNGPLGKSGWTLNILESKAMPTSERQMEVYLPTGLRLCLQKSRKDPNVWTSQRFEWIGKTQGDLLAVSCGSSEFQYWKGKLTRMRALDTSRNIEFVLNGSLIGGAREGGGHLELEIKIDPSTVLPKTMVVNRQEYTFSFENGLLASITWPGGTKETYHRGTDPSGNPMLTITGKNGGETAYTWNAKSRRIISDGEWTYQIGEYKPPHELPSLSRTNRKGQVESYCFDAKTGVSTYQALDGTITRRLFFLSPGLNYMRLRKIEQTANGETTTLLRRSYDERGLLLRETMLINGVEQTRSYRYDQAGNQVAALCDGKPLWQKRYDSQGWVVVTETPGREKSLFRYLDNGGREETRIPILASGPSVNPQNVAWAEDKKAVLLYNERGQCVSRRQPNGELWSYEFDEKGREKSTLVNGVLFKQVEYYPDGQMKLAHYFQKDGKTIARDHLYEYSKEGRESVETVSSGGKVLYAITRRYDEYGRIYEQDIPSKGVYRFTYGKDGRCQQTFVKAVKKTAKSAPK